MQRIQSLLNILKSPIAKIIAGALVIWIIICMIASLNSWKAVFMDSNQLFFGKTMSWPFASTITLRHVYYLQNDASASSTLKVLSVETDAHGPTDSMQISKAHILYVQELKDSSLLVKAIREQEARK